MAERLLTLGYEPVASTPAEFAKQITAELAIWANVVRAANIKVQ